ncbi:MAG: 3'-5' exonuclease, partial [Candidatus Poseidoniaceae archaeon]
DSPHALAVLARSSAFGLDDLALPEAFARLEESGNVWEALTVAPEHHREVARRCRALADAGAIHSVVDTLLDESDLLVAQCTDAERQHAERFALMLRTMSQSEGDDPVVLHERLTALSGLQRDGPPAIVEPSGGAVEIMTIHNAKGLEREVVVVAGLFSAGRQDPSQESRDNVRVLPDLVVARPRPWPSLPAPNDGLWRMAKGLGDAQAKAERARQFYVALTRVERHLIVAGAPEKATVDGSGRLTLPISEANTRTFGDHWMQALTELGLSADGEDSPWCPVSHEGGQALHLDPAGLLANAGLGEASIPSLLIVHDPEAASDLSTSTPLGHLEAVLASLDEVTLSEEIAATTVDHRFRITPHGLDAAKACPRRHWLEQVRGWRPEAFGQSTFTDEDGHEVKPRSSDVHEDGVAWPAPTVFGTMMHRVVELGLPNPVLGAAQPALPTSWTGAQPDRLLDDDVLRRVFEEHGLAMSDHPHVIERMKHLLGLMQRGRLGGLARGEKQHGRLLDGLRTEHPFFAMLEVPGEDLPVTRWTRGGRVSVATVPRPIAEV